MADLMVDPSLYVLTSIAVILLLGILGTVLSKKLKFPEMIFLIAIGIFMGSIQYNGSQLFEFSSTFILSISILALTMLIFDGSSQFKLKDLDKMSITSLKYIGVLMILSAIILGFIISLLFSQQPYGVENFLYGATFAILLVATDAAAVFLMLKDQSSKMLSLLKVESLFNTPLTVIIPLIIFEFIQKSGQIDIVSTLIDYITPLFLQIVVGLGSGLFIGFILFKIMKRYYSEKLSPLVLITAALCAYILAENLKGSGVLSVAVLGFVFGSVYVRQKEELMGFSSVFSTSLEILVFVLLGIVVKLPLDAGFFVKCLVVFLTLIFIRYGTAQMTLKSLQLTFKEKVFISTVMPKGISVAVVAFYFTTIHNHGINNELLNILIQMLFAIMIYSMIFCTIIIKASKKHLFPDKIPKIPAQEKKKMVLKAEEETVEKDRERPV